MVKRGDTLARVAGNEELAVRAYERARELDPNALSKEDSRVDAGSSEVRNDPRKRAQSGVARFRVEQAVNALQHDGNQVQARAAFEAALKLDPAALQGKSIDAQIADVIAPAQYAESVRLTSSGDVARGLALFSSTRSAAPNVKPPTDVLNLLCWESSLRGHAADVVDTLCEDAVRSALYSAYARDSRGIARALVGRRDEAISDFESYVQDLSRLEQRRRKRSEWIKALRAGRNPFTDQVLAELRSE
jgi:tetratricopeptide (TPR) repeat protein